jgi:hypothetical protein
MTEASVKPVKPPCKKLYVRKDFKCLTHKEKKHVINLFKRMYEKGVMDKFAEIHERYWSSAHKSSEAIMWHRWFTNEMEKEMRKIDPDFALPYWVYIFSIITLRIVFVLILIYLIQNKSE